MEVCALASGSSGNCFYIGKKENGILIDAGISCKSIESRMALIKKNPAKIKGIFITHEHSDHIKGADVFARKFKVPIFATKKLIENNFVCSDETLVQTIKKDEINLINGMEIKSFLKSHKAIEPLGFTITDIANGKKTSIITDAGYACENINREVSEVDALFFESNHDEQMVEDGPYPYFLKKWVRSDTGHLSNKQAANCVIENANKKLKNLVLCHISEKNNTNELALKTHISLIKKMKTVKPNISLSTKNFPTELVKLN